MSSLIFCGALLPAQDFIAHREQILRDQWLHLGPIYLTPRLVIKNFGYSDNIYQYQDIASDDWIADFGFHLQSDFLLGKRFIVTYLLMPEYHIFSRHKELSNWTIGQQLSLHTYLGPFTVQLQAQANQSWAMPNPEFGLSIRYKTNGANGQLSFGNPRHLNMRISVLQMENEYEDIRYLNEYNLSQFNHRLQSGGLAVNFRIFTQTMIGLSYDRQQLRYHTLPFLDADIDQLGFNLTLPEIGSLRGSLSIGLQQFSPKSNLFSRLQTPFGTGNFTFQPRKRWRLLMGYQIRVQDSFTTVDQMFVQNSWNLGFDFYLARRWRIGYRLNENNMQYRLRSQTEEIVRRDRFQMHGAVLAFRLGERSAIGLTWNKMVTLESTAQSKRQYSFIGGYLETDF